MPLIIALILIIILYTTFGMAGWNSAPWVRTRAHDMERFIKFANLKPGQKFYDLGCGDGKLLCAAAASGAEVYGIEIALVPYLLAQLRRLRSPFREHIHIGLQSFWKTSLTDADVVYLFLLPKIYQQLQQKLETELRPGAQVITYAWQIKEWKPVAIDEEVNALKLYKYQIT